MTIDRTAFRSPPWDAPLDTAQVLGALPRDATIAGMFFVAVFEGAKRRGVAMPAPRERYLPFGFYPLTDFVPLLLASATASYPELPLRQALRKLGSAGPAAFAGSMLGKVTLGSAQDVHAAVGAIVNTYSINVRPSRCAVLDAAPKSMVVSIENVYYFLDCHHVGVFEGTLEFAGVTGRVAIASKDAHSAELLLEW